MEKCQFPQSFGNTEESHETSFRISFSVVYSEYGSCVATESVCLLRISDYWDSRVTDCFRGGRPRLCSPPLRPTTEPTQSPLQRTPRSLLPGVKWSERQTDFHVVPWVRICETVRPLPDALPRSGRPFSTPFSAPVCVPCKPRYKYKTGPAT
jgi:hypothetical protein